MTLDETTEILNYAKGLTNTVPALLVRSLPYHNTDWYFYISTVFLCIMIWESMYLCIYVSMYVSIYLSMYVCIYLSN